MLIRLEQLTFHARHGVMPQESKVGGRFEVDVTLRLDDTECSGAVDDDLLCHTVNYAEVYAAVAEEMARPSALIEHVAGRMARRMLHDFPAVREVTVRVRKCCPPIEGFAGRGVSVEVTRHRRLVVWDFDGTLADTQRGIVRTMRLTLGECAPACSPTDDDIRQTIGLPLRDSIARLSGLHGGALDKAEDTYRRLFETEGVPCTTLFDGIADALRRQTERGDVVTIATSRGHQSVKELCERMGILQYIAHIIACEDVQHAKPHAEPVLRLCKTTGIRPAHTTVIGDTTYDMEMGFNAGVARCLGVTWGNHTAEMLARAGGTVVTAPEAL